MANIEVIQEVRSDHGEWQLCFQWARWHYDDGDCEAGYRFIWRRDDGSLQPARGQARIPNAAQMFQLIHAAIRDGWFIACEGG